MVKYKNWIFLQPRKAMKKMMPKHENMKTRVVYNRPKSGKTKSRTIYQY